MCGQNCFQTTFNFNHIQFHGWPPSSSPKLLFTKGEVRTLMMLSAAGVLSFVILGLGSISSIVLSRLLLKFYSTILFADTNIFTHLNKAAVVAIQVMVQSRVRVLFRCFSIS